MKIVRLYPFIGTVLLLTLALAFAGCAPQTSNWSTVEAPKENKVTLVRLNHSVRFTPGQNRLGAPETERLAQFLAQSDVGYGDQIALLASDTPQGRRQQDAVAAFFARSGLRVVRGAPVEGVAAAPDEVRITVARYVVTPPVCPNWSKPAGEDFTNESPSNFGCATTTNLGMMVANPGDLVGGQPLGPADGQVSAFSIEKYRAGKIVPLLRGDVSSNARTEVTKEAPQ